MSEPACLKIDHICEELLVEDAQIPLGVTADLTYRCNFHCHHCYCRLPQDAPQAQRELSFAEWDRILGECADEGVLFLTFTGGEPLLHPDFRKLWISAKRRGLLLELFTNGSLLTPEHVDLLAEWTPVQVSITLYAASEATHRDVTGTHGMLARVTSAIELLTNRGVKLELKTVLTRRNVHEFDALREVCAEYGDKVRWDAEMVGHFQEGGGDPFGERLSPEQVMALEAVDEERTAAWQGETAEWRPPRPWQGLFRCRVGTRSFHLDPYGNMRPCGLLEAIRYDLRTGSVREGWRQAMPMALAELGNGSGVCNTCPLADLCRYCPACALLEGTPLGGPAPVYCEMSQRRAEAYIGPEWQRHADLARGESVLGER